MYQYCHFDDVEGTYFGLAKSGRSGGDTDFRASSALPCQLTPPANYTAAQIAAYVFPYWVVDLQEPINFNYIRIVHRTSTGFSRDNWLFGFRVYGTNEYRGKINNWDNRAGMQQSAAASIYRDDPTVWTLIEGEKRVEHIPTRRAAKSSLKLTGKKLKWSKFLI